MSQPEPGLPPSVSVLQRDFSLAELIDLNSFRDVCTSYADLFKIGFKIFDRASELLVDVRGNSGDFCSYAFQFPAGKSKCTQEVVTIRDLDLPGPEPVTHDCFTGLRYLVAPIRHEGDLVGRIVYGPYWPQGGQPKDLRHLGEKYNPEIAQRLLAKVPRVANEVVHNVVRHLAQVIEVMLYTGYKQLLTSRLHVESVTTSYTELQRKNQQLRDSFERLKELDRLKSSFLATVSHELRTPLTSVIGYSEMLIEGLAGDMNEEQREYVQTIMEKGENLLGLIASILDFSKVESGNLRLNRQPTDIQEIIELSLQTVHPLALKQKIDLQSEIPADLPQLNIDSGKLRQALVNILGNAVKFNKAGGFVKVLVDRVARRRPEASNDGIPAALAPPDDQFLRIAISDSGIGIPKEQLHRVFDSFYQIDGSSTREYGGTGLGLAISSSYIEAHGGKIEVDSEPGKGSTFAILMPL
jgi:signal transduction histidine kinase